MSKLMVIEINDKRITNHTKRMRSGSTQIFYVGDDYRDFDRYQREGRKEMHDKPDTIRITPPEKHYYAELLGGEWWWVNGCDECNGERANYCYMKCVKHDVCVTCKCSREDLTETPWGTRTGWQCKPCAKTEAEAAKQAALQRVAEDEYEPYDFHHLDHATCPHCATEFKNIMDDGEPAAVQDCDVCGGAFSLEVEYSVTFSSQVIGERLKPGGGS